jgi:signal transduction histidine kinase
MAAQARPAGPARATVVAPDVAAGRVWSWWYLAGASVVTVAYYLLPRTGLLPPWVPKIGLYNGLGLSAVAAIVVGVRRYRPTPKLAWHLFAAGLGSFATADLIFYTLQDLLGRDVFPSVADVFYLASYPFMMGGLLLLIRARSPRPGSDRAGLIDALVVATGVGLLSWVFLMMPLARDPSLTLLERLVSLAYPVMDLLLVTAATRLAIEGGSRPPAFWLLVVSISSLFCVDSLYTWIQLSGGYHTGSPIDVGWMAWYACWGATALHPSMTELSEPGPDREVRLGRGRVGLLAGASLMAPAVVVLQTARGRPLDVPVIVTAAAWLFLLVLARLASLARQVAVQGVERKLLLDRTVRAAEEERARIAASLHDGPIQQLASLSYTAGLARLRLERGEVDASYQALQGLEGQLSGQVQALRQLMVELRPPVLDELGLPVALVDYASDFQRRTGITCTVRATPRTRLRLAAPAETILYRVAQEALNNVRQHAHATTIRVSLGVQGDQVQLRVSDDGVGFDLTRTHAQLGRDHYGLASMHQQVEMAGGAWEVRSHPGRGTTITATLPAAEAQAARPIE